MATKEAAARGEAQALATKEAKARGEAEEQERLALEKAELLAREDYVNRVNRAYREVQDDNVALAEDLLHGCDLKRRGWEWHFVERLCNSERRVLDLGKRVSTRWHSAPTEPGPFPARDSRIMGGRSERIRPSASGMSNSGQTAEDPARGQGDRV